MTDIEKAFADTPAPPRKRSPRFWQVLAGALVLLNLVTLGVGRFKEGRIESRLRSAAQRHAAALEKAEQLYAGKMKLAVRQKGESIARSFQMVNPNLLTADGQRNAQALFATLLADSHIAFIALIDANGAVCATSDLRLVRENAPATVTNVTMRKPGACGADIEFFGPITNSRGDQVGIVRVGMTFTPAGSGPAAQPAPAPAPEPPAEPPTTPEPGPPADESGTSEGTDGGYGET